MRNKIRIALLLTMVFLGAVIALVGLYQKQEYMLPISVQISSSSKTERVNCWKDNEGAYFVFLPSYANLSETTISLNTSSSIRVNGKPLCSGDDCGRFDLNVQNKLSYDILNKTNNTTLTFLKSANIATMYVNTDSGGMDYIHVQKGNEETGSISLYDSEGSLNYEDTQITLKGRGNATWVDSEKKSYSLDLSTAADLLEMGNAQRWILLANGLDQSNLRNKIVYDFAEKVGLDYSPESRWVDLYLNGEYAGLYLLCERIEIHPERLDISAENSFLMSSELEQRLIQQNYPYILTDTNLAMRIHYPKVITEDSNTVLTVTWKAIENSILAEDGVDPETGKHWKELIDLDSWAKKYLIDEVFGNLDAYLISQYYYINGAEADRKVYAGIVWDYDLSMGNTYTWQLENPYSVFVGNPKYQPGIDTPLIFSLSSKEEFYSRTVELYDTEFLPKIEELIKTGISAYKKEIEKASEMNQIRWSFLEDISFHQDYIISYLSKRTAFLQSMWADGANYCKVTIDQGTGSNYAYYMVLEGTCLNDLPQFEPTPYQEPLGLWYYSDTDEPFDISTPITEDIEIYAIWKDSSNKRLGQVVKIMPLVILAGFGIVLLMKDVYRSKKAWCSYGRRDEDQISS